MPRALDEPSRSTEGAHRMDQGRRHHAHDYGQGGREEVVFGCEEVGEYQDGAYGEEPLQVAGVDIDEEAPVNG